MKRATLACITLVAVMMISNLVVNVSGQNGQDPVEPMESQILEQSTTYEDPIVEDGSFPTQDISSSLSAWEGPENNFSHLELMDPNNYIRWKGTYPISPPPSFGQDTESMISDASLWGLPPEIPNSIGKSTLSTDGPPEYEPMDGGDPSVLATYNVEGVFQYEDRELDHTGFSGATWMNPIRYADVEVFDNDTSVVLATTYTNDTGYFFTTVTDTVTRNVVVRALTSSVNHPDLFQQRVRGSPSLGAPIYELRSPTYVNHPPTNPINFVSTPVIAVMDDVGGPFHMFDIAEFAEDYVENLTSDFPTHSLTLNWAKGEGLGKSYDLSGNIWLMGTTSDDDSYDDNVLLHEIGHYIGLTYSVDAGYYGGHSLTGVYDIRLTYTEGLGSYFMGAIRNYINVTQPLIYIETNGVSLNWYGFSMPLDTDTPSGYSGGALPDYTAANEVTVSHALYDVVDGIFSRDGTEGFDDDALDLPNMDGDKLVWAVLRAIKENESFFTKEITMETFVDMWINIGQYVPEFLQILQAHEIEYYEDAYEQDDDFGSATLIPTDGTKHHHTYYPAGDPDWSEFTGNSGAEYVIKTSELFDGADTILELYDTDGSTLLASNNDWGASKASLIDFAPPVTGQYYIKSYRHAETPTPIGEYGKYNLSIYILSNPEITSITPNTGPVVGGTVVNITGFNFTVGATVMFGVYETTNVIVYDANTINATTPANIPGPVNVTIVNPPNPDNVVEEGTAVDGFTYTGDALAPIVTSITPDFGSTTFSTNVTVKGEYIINGAVLLFGSTVCLSYNVIDPKTVNATVQPLPQDLYDVNITNPDGKSGVLRNAFESAVQVRNYTAVSVGSPPLYTSLYVNEDFIISDLYVYMNVSNPGNTNSFKILLTSPGGITTRVLYRISVAVVENGSLVWRKNITSFFGYDEAPSEGLYSYKGEHTRGNWTLNISCGGTGTLHSWGLVLFKYRYRDIPRIIFSSAEYRDYMMAHNAENGEILYRVRLGQGLWPMGAIVSSDMRFVCGSHYYSEVLCYETLTGKWLKTFIYGGRQYPFSMASARDINRMVVFPSTGILHVINMTTMTEEGNITLLELKTGETTVSISPDGTRAYISNRSGEYVQVIDLDSLVRLGQIVTTGYVPGTVSLSWDGLKGIIVTGSDNMLVFNATTEVVTDVLDVPWGSYLEFTPDGTKGFYTRYQWYAGFLSIDLVANTSKSYKPHPESTTWGLTIARDNKVYVSDWYQHKIWVYDAITEAKIGEMSTLDGIYPSGTAHVDLVDKVTNLVASPGNGVVNLTWDVPFSPGTVITGYKIYKGTESGKVVFLTNTSTLNSYQDTAVVNGQSYYYRVSAVNGAGEGPMSVEAMAIPVAPPSEPLGLVAVAGDSYVNLTWNPPLSTGGTPIVNYRIYRGTVSNGEVFLTEIGNFTEYNDTAVMNSITYYYKVSAKNYLYEGPMSNEAFDTPRGPPSAPQNPQVSSGDNYVNVTWDAPAFDGGSPVTNYEVHRSTVSGAETFLADAGNILYYNDTSVTNGITYYYKVLAENLIGPGLLSNEVNATPFSLPSGPQNLQGLDGKHFVKLTWGAPADDGGCPIMNYTIYRGTSPGVVAYLAEIGNFTEFNDTGLPDWVTYYYRVSATNCVGEGPQSNEVTGIPISVPTAPTIVTVMPGNGIIEITWSPPANDGGSPVENYIVYRGTVSGGQVFVLQLGIVTTYIDTGLTNGMTYYYKVSALNSVGEGPMSNEASGIPAGPPSAPQNLVATLGTSSIDLTWSAPLSNGGAPIAHYWIYRGSSQSTLMLLTEIGNVLSYSDTSVTGGNTYYYGVSAVNIAGESPLSNTASAAVPEPPNVLPTCTITSPTGGASVSGIVEISGTASDSDDSVQLVEIKIDDGDWLSAGGTTSWSYGWNSTTISHGQHTIYARSYDGRNYSQVSSVEITVTDPLTSDHEGSVIINGLWILLVVLLVIMFVLLLFLLKKRKGKPGSENGKILSLGLVFILVFAGFAGMSNITTMNVQAVGTPKSGVIMPPGETWNPTGSPYWIEGNLTVANGATLTIEPGVTVKFNGFYVLFIEGELNAVGTMLNAVTFTSNESSPTKGFWDKIQVNSTGNVNIVQGTISYARLGLHIISSSYNNVTDSLITNNNDGMRIEASSHIELTNNTFLQNGPWGALYLISVSDSIIEHNVVRESYYGIRAWGTSSNNNVRYNELPRIYYALLISGMSNSFIEYNNISDAVYEGLNVGSGSNNIVAYNTVKDSATGLRLGGTNNSVYNNNFIGNNLQASDNSVNANRWNISYYWDDPLPSGGNYWGDYDEPSEGCIDWYNGSATPQVGPSPDGICDSNYSIDANNSDYYPLKRPVGSPPPDKVPPMISNVFINGASVQTYPFSAIPPLMLTVEVNDILTGNSNVTNANYTTGFQLWSTSNPMTIQNPPPEPNEIFEALLTTPTVAGAYYYYVYAEDEVPNFNVTSNEYATLIIVDDVAPRILDVLIDGAPSQTYNVFSMSPTFTLSATLNDSTEGGSFIGTSAMGGANYTLGAGNWASSVPMDTADGTWEDDVTEAVQKIVPTPTIKGTHVFCVYGRDIWLNNNTTGSCAQITIIDDAAPVIINVMINNAPIQSYPLSSIPALTLTAEVDDIPSGGSNLLNANYTLGPQAWGTSQNMVLVSPPTSPTEIFTAPLEIPLLPGTFDYYVYVSDDIPNYNTTSFAYARLIIYDDLPPAVENFMIDGALTQTYYVSSLPPSFTLSATINDTYLGSSFIGTSALGGANFTIGSGMWSTSQSMDPVDGTWQDDVMEDVIKTVSTPTSAGIYTYCIYGWDSLPNYNTVGSCIQLTIIDDKPPEISNVEVDGQTSVTVPSGTLVTLTGTADDSSTGGSRIRGVNFTVGQGNWPGINMSSTNPPFDGQTEDFIAMIDTTGWSFGTYDIYVYGWDDAQNENVTSTAYATIIITYDTTLPEITNIRPANESSCGNGTPTIVVTFNDAESGIDVDSIVLKIDGSDVTSSSVVTSNSVSYTPSSPLSEGQHTVYIEVKDGSPNENMASRSWSFTVSSDQDRTASPGVSLTDHWWLVLLIIIIAVMIFLLVIMLMKKEVPDAEFGDEEPVESEEEQSGLENEETSESENETLQELDTNSKS